MPPERVALMPATGFEVALQRGLVLEGKRPRLGEGDVDCVRGQVDALERRDPHDLGHDARDVAQIIGLRRDIGLVPGPARASRRVPVRLVGRMSCSIA